MAQVSQTPEIGIPISQSHTIYSDKINYFLTYSGHLDKTSSIKFFRGLGFRKIFFAYALSPENCTYIYIFAPNHESPNAKKAFDRAYQNAPDTFLNFNSVSPQIRFIRTVDFEDYNVTDFFQKLWILQDFSSSSVSSSSPVSSSLSSSISSASSSSSVSSSSSSSSSTLPLTQEQLDIEEAEWKESSKPAQIQQI